MKPSSGTGSQPRGETTPSALDLTKLLRSYENQWVALSTDHTVVLGAGPTLQEAKARATKTGKPYRFLKVLPFDINFIPVGG